MIVRMRSNYSGPRGQARSGKHINLPSAEAKELIDGGYAVRDSRPPVDVEVIQSGAPEPPRHTQAVDDEPETQEPEVPAAPRKRRATKPKE